MGALNVWRFGFGGIREVGRKPSLSACGGGGGRSCVPGQFKVTCPSAGGTGQRSGWTASVYQVCGWDVGVRHARAVNARNQTDKRRGVTGRARVFTLRAFDEASFVDFDFREL